MKLPPNVPWEIIEKLDSGGQGTVYVARPRGDSVASSARFALKHLRNVRSEQARSRFAKEIDALTRIDHPFIPKIVDHSGRYPASNSADFYVMELRQGFVPLEDEVYREDSIFRANPTNCLVFIENLLAALQASHQAGIVHRDIKPGNVLVHKATLVPALVDFGCCQIVDGDSITLTDENIGSRNYSAPEAEAGSGRTCDARSDIYSVGKLLWTMVTGQKAFAREAPAFDTKNLASIFPQNPDVWHLTDFFSQSIRHEPHLRFHSAYEAQMFVRVLQSHYIRNFPPLELAQETCAACGDIQRRRAPVTGNLGTRLENIFGQPDSSGVLVFWCNRCGLLNIRNYRIPAALLEERKKLQ